MPHHSSISVVQHVIRLVVMSATCCADISYVSSLSLRTRLSPQIKIERIQTCPKRVLLNTSRIQDSRFKVPGRTLPCTLDLESWIRGVFNRIRLNTECRAFRIVNSRYFVLYYCRYRAVQYGNLTMVMLCFSGCCLLALLLLLSLTR